MTKKQQIILDRINEVKEEKRSWFEKRLAIINGNYPYNLSLKKCTEHINYCDKLIAHFREMLNKELEVE